MFAEKEGNIAMGMILHCGEDKMLGLGVLMDLGLLGGGFPFVCLRCFLYRFYHGKSPFFTTI